MQLKSPYVLFAGLLLIALLSLLFALRAGSVEVAWADILGALAGNQADVGARVIVELRLPRAATAFVVGGLLAVSGALLQVLLRNPLADPYVLGISGGAGVGALTALVLGAGSLWVSGAAFGGALLSVLLVFGLAHGSGGWTSTRLLLTGVVLAAGWGALISLILALGPDTSLRGMLFWLMGDLSDSALPWWPVGLLLGGLLLAMAAARDLDLLARGDLRAAALGVETRRLRLLVYFLASGMTATAVSLAGAVGFVGLVVPHMLRLLAGANHRRLLPAAVLAGGSLLVLADTLARVALAPRQLPVGVVTALIGVPLFLYLLNRGSRTGH